MYGLDQFGIQVIKPSGQFASKTERFKEQEKALKKWTPGPGSYAQNATQFARVQQRTFSGKGSQGMRTVEWKKPTEQPQLLPNPPSIPSHNNVFGYQENARGELIR